MANIEKKAERGRKARAYKDLVGSLASVSRMIHRPTASVIFDSLNSAHLNEQHAASSQLAREVLFQEDPAASVPEELSDQTISQYLANAGGLYGNAATDYVLTSDLARAFKYFRKAAQHCSRAMEIIDEDGSELHEKVQDFRDKTAIIRQQLARKSIRRKRLSLGILGRLR